MDFAVNGRSLAVRTCREPRPPHPNGQGKRPTIGNDRTSIGQALSSKLSAAWNALSERPAACSDSRVILDISTPALLFPAISLLFLSFTNRFLHLAALIRQLHRDWLERGDETLRAQIDNLRRRLALIRAMQLLGAVSLLLCVASMLEVVAERQLTANATFAVALVLMALSLACLVVEVWISGGALRILLRAVEHGEGRSRGDGGD